ncbi:hypothetical protein Tco_0558237 [Tanacetum coccineum]
MDHLNQCWQQDFEEYTLYEPVTESTTLEANLSTDVKALDVGLVFMKGNGAESRKQDTRSNSVNYITHAVNADIRPVNKQVPFAEVQLTAQHNILANEQQHTEQSEPIYDTYLLEKSVKNADVKAQIQEKVFANAALKNELRKLKGNSMDTKFAKASILGKPPLQPSRNHSVVRQPNVFKSERPRISKPRFASQVDVKHNLPKPVTPHYFPKVRESAPAKPHHVNAPSSSRNSKKESYGSNDMAHNHYLEEARKKTQERNKNSMCEERNFCEVVRCEAKLGSCDQGVKAKLVVKV